MKIQFSRRRLEQVSLLLTLGFLSTTLSSYFFAIADVIFRWDLLPKNLEKVAGLAIAGLTLATVCCLVLNLVLNLSLLSTSLQKIANRGDIDHANVS